MSLIIAAARFAANAHAKQLRKYTSRPYIEHPARVAARVTLAAETYNYVSGECLVAAAWLHDVLEDCPVTVDDIQTHLRRTGCESDTTMSYITALTNPSKKYPWLSRADRRRIDREHLSVQAGEVQRIKMYDRIDNLCEMDGAPEDFKRLYLLESMDLLVALDKTPRYLQDELKAAIRALDATLPPT